MIKISWSNDLRQQSDWSMKCYMTTGKHPLSILLIPAFLITSSNSSMNTPPKYSMTGTSTKNNASILPIWNSQCSPSLCFFLFCSLFSLSSFHWMIYYTQKLRRHNCTMRPLSLSSCLITRRPRFFCRIRLSGLSLSWPPKNKTKPTWSRTYSPTTISMVLPMTIRWTALQLDA